MDAGQHTGAGLDPTSASEGLRAGDPEAIASFIGSWGGAVHAYCAAVCEPDLVLEAAAIAFSDFLWKLENHPIDDAHLQSALIRSTRLSAAEAAMIDEDKPAAEGEGKAAFKCELTPLLLA